MTETLVPVPEDPYGIAKLAVEQDLKTAAEMFGLNFVIFRPHNVYGELQNTGDLYRNVIGIFMNQLLTGKSLTLFGDGMQTRAFSYIDDVAPYIAKSVLIPEAINEVFNIGADQEYSVLELADKVMQAMGIKKEIQFLPERLEVKHAWADHAKAKKTFHINELTPLDSGLKKMAEWAMQSGSKTSGEFTDIEIHKNLPKSWTK
jgi:UDP-glucose 4-epimerase